VTYLPDTNVLSRYLRNRREDGQLCDRFEEVFPECRLSAIALMELEYGAAKRRDILGLRNRIERLKVAFGSVDSFGEEAAYQAGFVRAFLANLKPNAQPIGPYDALLAGHALALGAVFVTGNTREFERVPGLVVEDWAA
jgi:tRNA(fMet)-specific endonuclease VapC